jgi:hypothetical protein
MLRVERAGAGHHTCVGPDDPVVPGYQVTVDVKLETTDSCATIGVGRPDGARYRVAVCTGAVKVDRPDRDDATRPVTSLPMAQPLRAEQRTTVEVLVTDEVLEVFRDGHRLGRAVVPEPPEAGPVQLGLQAAPAGQPARSAVSFANVDIRPL